MTTSAGASSAPKLALTIKATFPDKTCHEAGIMKMLHPRRVDLAIMAQIAEWSTKNAGEFYDVGGSLSICKGLLTMLASLSMRGIVAGGPQLVAQEAF
jgi:hypothetical protein